MKTVFILLCCLASSPCWAANDFLKLFSVKRPVIAAIKGQADFTSDEDLQKSKAWTIQQARIAADNGMDGFLLEFEGGGILDNDITPKRLAIMADITRAVIANAPKLVVGVEILWHFPGSTLLLAKNSGAKFVRVDFFSDRVIADGNEVPIDPKNLLAFREKIGASGIALLTDIQVKYSEMVDPKITIADSAVTARASGSDGVIVSGAKSGSSADSTKFLHAQKAVTPFPVLTGSGFSRENAPMVLPYVDAVIVGTSISEQTGGPLIPEKVKALMTYVQTYRKSL
jgi:predicted TIM-barrel enzyme